MNLILTFSNLLLAMMEMRRLFWSCDQRYQGMVLVDRAREVILETDFTIIFRVFENFCCIITAFSSLVSFC